MRLWYLYVRHKNFSVEQLQTDGHYTLIHDARVRLVGNVRAAGGRPQ